MDIALLYTLPECPACIKAYGVLSKKGYSVRTILIDNPLLELGVGLLFNDRKAHAPLAVLPDQTLYLFNDEQMFKIGNLSRKQADTAILPRRTPRFIVDFHAGLFERVLDFFFQIITFAKTRHK
jgi:hypothetical protein